MEMCRWFFKVLLKFKMTDTNQLQLFLWAKKLKNLMSVVIQILQSHSPRYGDVQVMFSSRFYWNLNRPPWMNFIFLVGLRKTQKLKSEIIQFSHYPPSWNVHVILLKFKMATTSRFFKYLWPQKLDLIYGGGWYRTSDLLFQFEIIINVLVGSFCFIWKPMLRPLEIFLLSQYRDRL